MLPCNDYEFEMTATGSKAGMKWACGALGESVSSTFGTMRYRKLSWVVPTSPNCSGYGLLKGNAYAASVLLCKLC
jgi:hypothetical protein